MRSLKSRLAMAVMVLGFAAGQASADLVYVGSWTVDQGPRWTDVPAIYTGQEAAALLFGGSASDYAISTVSANVADVNNMAWYSPWGGATDGYTGQPNGNNAFPVGILASESMYRDYNANGLYDVTGELSAYVNDWAIGVEYTNYAFRINVVPEPSTLLSCGLGGLLSLGFVARRRLRQVNA